MRTHLANNKQHPGTLQTALSVVNLPRLTLAILTLSMLAACGGSDSISEPDSSFAKANTAKQPEVQVRKIADTISSNIGLNLDSVAVAAGFSSAVSSIVDTGIVVQLQTAGDDNGAEQLPLLDNTTDSTTNRLLTLQNDAQESAKSALELLLDDDSGTSRAHSIQQMLLPTLGIGGNGLITRAGSTITIDPDEGSICDEWLAGTDYTSADDQQCTDLLSHLSVQIDPLDDDSGLLSYLFSGRTVVSVNYSATQGSYQVSLAGVKTVLEQLATDTNDNSDIPDVMLGTVKLTATVTNDSPGAEAGSILLAVTEALRITDTSKNTHLQLGVSDLLTVSADAASRLATMALDIVDLSIAAREDDEDAAGQVLSLQAPAFTMTASMSDSGNTISVSNFGMGSGPLTIAVDGSSAMQMSLPPFAIKSKTEPGSQEILQNFDLNIDISDWNKLDDSYPVNSSASYSAYLPANTILHNQDSGGSKLVSGGPAVFNYAVNDGQLNPAGSLSVGAGECFSSDEEDTEWFTAVECD